MAQMNRAEVDPHIDNFLRVYDQFESTLMEAFRRVAEQGWTLAVNVKAWEPMDRADVRMLEDSSAKIVFLYVVGDPRVDN